LRLCQEETQKNHVTRPTTVLNKNTQTIPTTLIPSRKPLTNIFCRVRVSHRICVGPCTLSLQNAVAAIASQRRSICSSPVLTQGKRYSVSHRVASMNIIVTVTHATHAPKSDTVVFSWHEKARVGGTCSIVFRSQARSTKTAKKKKSAIISPARHTPSNQSIRTSRVGPNQYICIKPLATETAYPP